MISRPQHKTLCDMPAGTKVSVDTIASDHARMMLMRMGMDSGSILRVKARIPGGAVVVDNAGCEMGLGQELAKNVNVSTLHAAV